MELKGSKGLIQFHRTQSIASAQHLQRLEQSLNGGPLWQAPVCFVDAFDKCYPIHLELISSYEDLNDLLIIKFRHAGHEMIRRREFVLREHKTNTFLNFDRPWKFFFSPRQTVVMSMVFLPKYEGMPSTEVCTMCNTNFTCHNGIHTWYGRADNCAALPADVLTVSRARHVSRTSSTIFR